MAVGKKSIMRAANAGSKTDNSSVKNVEFLTQVSEEVEEAVEVVESQKEEQHPPHIGINEKMPSYLL